jgi:hypothetical protein
MNPDRGNMILFLYAKMRHCCTVVTGLRHYTAPADVIADLWPPIRTCLVSELDGNDFGGTSGATNQIFMNVYASINPEAM